MKIKAAKTALAPPSFMPSIRWSILPTPPDAITGISSVLVILFKSSVS